MSRATIPVGLVVGGSPRANLLPPEIARSAALRSQRRGLFVLIVLALLLVAGGYVYATSTEQAAESELALANEETAAILAEQAQYAPAQQASSKIAAVKAARATVTTAEIDWKAYTELITGAAPEGTQLVSLLAVVTSDVNPLAAPTSPLEEARVAEVTISGRSKDVPDVVSWLEGLQQLPGYTDATPTSVSEQEGSYLVTITMHLDEVALLNRFAAEAAQ